ncbi:hypothetical protein [Lacrimispora indolis]|uniref:hypothetical protein n=1 Tax=Lacrimispora indolis TaxID=69825 RepID=UPI000462C6C5|nr:hypothetical protein [[Clostridium] methoxybenzovorans]
MDKDSIKSRVKRETIMMLIFGISGWIMFIIFFYSPDRRKAIPEKSESEIEEELNQMVERHLENKYGERFIIVEPRYGSAWHTTTQGSPVPGGSVGGESGFPRYCIAYAESDMDFKFRVYVYRESLEKRLDINNVKEIQDSYSWKFLKEKVREYFDTRMAEKIPDERKWIISTVEDLRFDDDINKDSSLEQYFSEYNSGEKIDLWVNLIVNGESEDADLQEDLYSVTKAFCEKYDGKVSIYLLCFKAEVAEDFINLYEEKTENLHFLKVKGFDSWREKFKLLFRIEDFDTMS